MSCETGCPCCHGACCTDGSCQPGVNCYDCVAEGGEWQGAGSTCDPDPCDECETDEDCTECEETFAPVSGCSGISDELRCCPEGSAGWVDDAGDARFGRCLEDCEDPLEDGESPGTTTTGYCCNGQCQEEECESPIDVFSSPSADDCCQDEGLVSVGVSGGGQTLCCPEDWEYDAPNLSCNPPGYEDPP